MAQQCSHCCSCIFYQLLNITTPVITDFMCASVLQNVGSVRQLLYDFPWTNVGKLVFVVSLMHHHNFSYSTHFSSKVQFVSFTHSSDDETQSIPLAYGDVFESLALAQGRGNFYARLLFSTLLFYLNPASPLELIRDLGRLSLHMHTHTDTVYYIHIFM